MKTVVLLNPPGKQLYLRDYYCSKISKTGYLYHPTELLVLSGILSEHYNIKVIDAIAEQLSAEHCYEKIKKLDPLAIVFITGSVSYHEDFPFLRSIKETLPNTLLIGSGDILNDNHYEIMDKEKWLDAILLDFTTHDIIQYLQGDQPNNMVYRLNNETIVKPRIREKGIEFSIPIPRYELFPNNKYRYPFVRGAPFATVLTDYGCPYKCSFCIMSQIGFKWRSVENVMEELQYIKSLGMRDVYFNDQTFGANRKRAVQLLNQMIDSQLNFRWMCFSRGDVTTLELLKLMKKAGCHTIIYGVESGNNDILKKYQKAITKEKVREAFAHCKQLQIRIAATFILGLPEDTVETIEETISFAKEINCDFVSFNVAVPRIGTELRQEAIDSNLAEDVQEMDQSGNYPIMDTHNLSKQQIHALHKRALWEFYSRPHYLFNRLFSIKTFYELKSNLHDLTGIVKSVLK
ncbi:MAG: radical SAM protein [SAR324 cluster bacterium]|nr:radical SAM protein [SAR324 cluster bacterium]